MSTGGELEVISCLSEVDTDAIGGRLKTGDPSKMRSRHRSNFNAGSRQCGADSFLNVKRLPMRQVHQLDSCDLAHDEL